MGEMGEMHMAGPPNTLPMMAGVGPFGAIAMGGMFTIVKVRDHLDEYTDAAAGWFDNPPGTVSESITPASERAEPIGYECPMHPEVFQPTQGSCPKRGMTLRAKYQP